MRGCNWKTDFIKIGLNTQNSLNVYMSCLISKKVSNYPNYYLLFFALLPMITVELEESAYLLTLIKVLATERRLKKEISTLAGSNHGKCSY